MCVQPISALSFRAGKIELNAINRKDLSNYDSIQLLARQSYCDFLIEKKQNLKYTPDYNVFQVLARRKWINSKYIYGQEFVTLHKNTPSEKVAEKIYELSLAAVKNTRKKILDLAKTCIK